MVEDHNIWLFMATIFNEEDGLIYQQQQQQ